MPVGCVLACCGWWFSYRFRLLVISDTLIEFVVFGVVLGVVW